MVKMKTDNCPTCGGLVFKLAGKASKLCHDECLDCRRKREQDLANRAAEMAMRQAEPDNGDRFY